MFILGGSSGWRRISVYSKKMEATAYCDKLGNITCNAGPRKKESGTRDLLMMASGTLFLACIWFMETIVPEDSFLQRCKLFVFLVIGTLIVLLYSRFFTAAWHGAEHMVITTYRQKRSTDMNDIEKQNPISETCGTRFLLLIYSFAMLCCILEVITDNFLVAIISLFVLFAGFKLMPYRWIEIPGSLRFSFFVQRHFTIRKPSKQQLLTAQRAVEELIAASKSCAC